MANSPTPAQFETDIAGSDAADRRKRAAKSRRRGQSLNDAIERQIDENLRRLYSEVAEEPLPEHLRQLLDQLKNRNGPQ